MNTFTNVAISTDKEICMLAEKFKANVKYAANHPEEFQDIIQITPVDLKEMLLQLQSDSRSLNGFELTGSGFSKTVICKLPNSNRVIYMTDFENKVEITVHNGENHSSVLSVEKNIE